MLALVFAAAGYRLSTTCSSVKPLQQLQAATRVMMQEESPGPPEEAPEDVAPPAPAPYGTEAYFAQQKAAKGIAVPDEEGKEGFFEIFGLSGARDKPPPPPATKIEDVRTGPSMHPCIRTLERIHRDVAGVSQCVVGRRAQSPHRGDEGEQDDKLWGRLCPSH